MANGYANGHLKDLVTGKPVTVDVASAVPPLAIAQGFLRDANYAIVTKAALATPQTLVGFMREGGATNYYAVTSIAQGSAVAPVTVQYGLARDANYALVV